MEAGLYQSMSLQTYFGPTKHYLKSHPTNRVNSQIPIYMFINFDRNYS